MSQKTLFTDTLAEFYGVRYPNVREAAWQEAAPTIRGAGDIAARDYAARQGWQPVRELPPHLMPSVTLCGEAWDKLAGLLGLAPTSAPARACRLVFVDGWGLADAARQTGCAYRSAWRTANRVRDGLEDCKIIVDSTR